ncbi:Zn(2)-C6 fungal-type DNA-binding domain [Lasallia pustulata]|uniref:Zn(2)-C6 fungal-type DNA-binding domain n=1 Tax=Lasallia pustulata TaxID=136370 RepID=A0A1W5D3J9_9LECA|nr:Zn(2)-C6 fungal-type DNA-binding domain [Lasallia pustulata]
MPNTGKPSRGCYLCRTRRVKCDLTRPSCLRCAKYETPCPGYRQELDLRFQNENMASIRQRKQKTWPKTPDSSHSIPPSTDSPPGPSSWTPYSPKSQVPFPLLKAIPDSQHVHSIPLLLDYFSATAVDGTRFFGYHDFLPSLFTEAPESPCLALSTNMFARAHFFNQSKNTINYKESARLYGDTLKSIREALCSSSERQHDASITAVWILGNYEILVGSPEKHHIPAPDAWHTHSQGLVSLLRLRGSGQFSTRRGRNIFWITHGYVLKGCLVANVEGPPESHSWLDTLSSDLQEADMLPFLVGSSVENACVAAHSLLEEANAFENIIQGHPYTFPARRSDPSSQHLWNVYRSARAKLHHYVLLLLNFVETCPHQDHKPPLILQQRQTSVAIVRAMVQEILDNVPYTLRQALVTTSMASTQSSQNLCWAHALQLVLPLTFASLLATAFPRQRHAAKGELECLGRPFNAHHALKGYLRPVKLPAEADWKPEHILQYSTLT